MTSFAFVRNVQEPISPSPPGDNTIDDTTNTDLENPPMLMVHGSHFAVSWHDGTPRVEAHIPTADEDVVANNVFVPTSSTLYQRGGKTFRATFAWYAGAMQEEQTEEKDVMLCYVGECDICDITIPTGATRNRSHGKPFVHSYCVEVNVGTHTFDAFTPKGDLKGDYARAYPEARDSQVVFDDGETRDVLMCVARTCGFCNTVSKGKNPPKERLAETEKEKGRDKIMKNGLKQGWPKPGKVGRGGSHRGKGKFKVQKAGQKAQAAQGSAAILVHSRRSGMD